MTLWRRATRGQSPCPACDAPLDTSLAQDDHSRCPKCGQPLLAVEVAGLWRRTAATLVDLAILLPTAGVLSWGLVRLVTPKPVVHSRPGLGAVLELLAADPSDVLGWIAPFLLMSGFYVLLFSGLVGRTLGQRLLGIRVVDGAGRRPRPAISMLRLLAHAVGLVPGALGSLWIAFDAHKRAFHDHVAGTYVVFDP
jgi:uncharacterized RDD family membrane protein YckC